MKKVSDFVVTSWSVLLGVSILQKLIKRHLGHSYFNITARMEREPREYPSIGNET